MATDPVRPIVDHADWEFQEASDLLGGCVLLGNPQIDRAIGDSEVLSDVVYEQPRLSQFGASRSNDPVRPTLTIIPHEIRRPLKGGVTGFP